MLTNLSFIHFSPQQQRENTALTKLRTHIHTHTNTDTDTENFAKKNRIYTMITEK